MDGVFIEEVSDATFNVAFDCQNSTWRINYTIHEGWIQLYAPLTQLDDNSHLALIQAALRHNMKLGVMRFALRDNTLSLRGEFPELDFKDDEFRLVSQLAVETVKRMVEEMGLRSFQT